MNTPAAVARAQKRTAGRATVLRGARPDTRTAVRTSRCPRAAASDRGSGWVRRRFAPHQLRHVHAVEMSREGISLIVIQRQLGHADLAITSRYLRGIDNTEIIAAVHERPAPMIPADPLSAFRRRHPRLVRESVAAVSPRPHPPAADPLSV